VFNIAQPIKGQRTTINAASFRTPGILMATCDAGHPWMSAYIVVAEHPYYAVTDAGGKFTLNDVPPGSYTVVMWHEGVNISRIDSDRGKPRTYYFEEPYEATKEVVVSPNGEAVVEFQLVLR
jgi:hypothetical protein